MDKNALHIWPRGRFMLIALANEDGSFTCTLFMPHEGSKHAFDSLTSKTAVDNFFKEVFPDFYTMMPNIADAWEDHPLSSLAIIRCHPWTSGKVALMGDAAHATVPFYGQGMNAGFEDCTVLWDLMQKHSENWPAIFEEYNRTRKPDGDALQDLSLDNYYVMRDYVADPKFLLQKKIEAKFPSTRFITIGLWPGFGGKKACIRLQGKWLRDAGFIPRWQVKVTVTEGKLVLEPIKPAERYLG
jgi:kynurenine 3-monooxygenase